MELTDSDNIKRLLGRHGFRFEKSKGQNFLIAPWVPERIAELAGLDSLTGAVEIGPGVGRLTEQLARLAGKVLAYELDESLRPVLNETLSIYKNIEILYADVMTKTTKMARIATATIISTRVKPSLFCRICFTVILPAYVPR